MHARSEGGNMSMELYYYYFLFENFIFIASPLALFHAFPFWFFLLLFFYSIFYNLPFLDVGCIVFVYFILFFFFNQTHLHAYTNKTCNLLNLFLCCFFLLYGSIALLRHDCIRKCVCNNFENDIFICHILTNLAFDLFI